MTSQEFIKTLASAKVLASKLTITDKVTKVQDYLANNGIHAGYNIVSMFLLGANITVESTDIATLLMLFVVDDYRPEFDMTLKVNKTNL